MKVEFKITNIPKADQKKYPTAYLEGILKIYIRDVLFFDQSEILLIEFAIFVDRWLKSIKKGMSVDFSFESMDHDDPILTLNFVRDDFYKIESVWQETEVSELLYKDEIVLGFEEYLCNLHKKLKIKMGVELNSILEDCQL